MRKGDVSDRGTLKGKRLLALGVLLAALPPTSVAEGLQDVKHFRADGVSRFNGADTTPQTATLKGGVIGEAATMVWEIDNVVVFGPAQTINGIVNCGLKDGKAKITTSNGDTITMSLGGSGCAETPVGSGTGNVAVTYWITGGTGRFVSARGSGSFSWGFANTVGGAGTVHLNGNIVIPFDSGGK